MCGLRGDVGASQSHGGAFNSLGAREVDQYGLRCFKPGVVRKKPGVTTLWVGHHVAQDVVGFTEHLGRGHKGQT